MTTKLGRVLALTGLLAALAWCAGCGERRGAHSAAQSVPGDNGEKPAAQQQAAPKDAPMAGCARIFEDRTGEARKLLDAGKTNESLAVLRRTFYEFDEGRSMAFSEMIGGLLRAGLTNEARGRVISSAGRDAALTWVGFRAAHRHFSEAKQLAVVVDWWEQLLRADMPRESLPWVYSSYMDACMAGDCQDKVVSAVSDSLARCAPIQARRLTLKAVQILLSGNRRDIADKVLATVESSPAAAAGGELDGLAILVRAELLAYGKEWGALVELLKTQADRIQDDDWSAKLAAACRGATGEYATVAEDAAEFALRQLKDKPHSRATAAREWVRAAVQRKAMDAAMGRIEALQTVDVSTDVRWGVYREAFYQIMEQEGPAAAHRIVAAGEAILSGMTAVQDKSELMCMLLDASFMTSDFDAALSLVGRGIPDKTEEWHKLVTAKLEAHRALAAGNGKLAVEKFREFMTLLSRSEDDAQTDPATSERVPNAAVLGLNAKRIGDILRGMGDAQGSGSAYAEARSHYEAALATLPKDSSVRPRIEKEMAEVGN